MAEAKDLKLIAEGLDEKEIPEVEKIYFDMDGVLADFSNGIRKLCGIEPPPQPEDVPEEEKEATKIANDKMWEKVRVVDHFYDKLELMPGAKEMFDAVYKKYGEKCQILTGIPKKERGIVTAKEDKEKWVARVLSKDVNVNVVYTENKPTFITNKNNTKGYILIDDLENNIKKWKEIGGSGFMNVESEHTIDRLKKLGILD